MIENFPARFFVFNWYRLGIGIEAEYGCTEGLVKTTILKVSSDVIETNSTLKSFNVFDVDDENNETTLIGKTKKIVTKTSRFSAVFALAFYNSVDPSSNPLKYKDFSLQTCWERIYMVGQ